MNENNVEQLPASVENRFLAVAEALGLDPKAVVVELMEAWLENLKSQARLAG